MPGLWRHFPWLLGLALSPMLAGSVGLEGKAPVALLFGISLWLLASRHGGADGCSPSTPSWIRWAVVFCLVLPLLPLPLSLVRWIDPQRVDLANAFPTQGAHDPAWLMLTISPASSIDRFAECFLVFTAFWLCRIGAADRGFGQLLAWTVAATLALLACSELWLQWDSQRRLLGVWPDPAGHAAGTFANRNHFANWVYVGSLFAAGWLLRQCWPLMAVRGASHRPPALTEPRLLLAAFGLVLLLASVLAVKTGSRGGLLALLSGILAWALLLRHRSHDRRRWFAMVAVMTLAVLGLLAGGGYLLQRIGASGVDGAFKLSIWREALGVIARFPAVGTGLGTFATAFNHFKSFGGSSTFLHAENEVVELIVEHGMIGALALIIGLRMLLVAAARFSWAHPLPEPELIFGAMAGLTAFASHALVEFVWQIPANAILASALLGYVLGSRDAARRPSVTAPPTQPRCLLNIAWSLAALAMAVLQGGAAWHWQQARRAQSPRASAAHLDQSLTLWPGSTTRTIALIRALWPQPRGAAGVEGVLVPDDLAAQRALARGLRLDPYNWELHLEGAWLDLASPDRQDEGLAAAWRCLRLHPLQPQIPIQFADYFAGHRPDVALRFLEAAATDRPDEQRQIYELAWKINPDPALLWSLTPETPSALRVLADFAQTRHLTAMAARAEFSSP